MYIENKNIIFKIPTLTRDITNRYIFPKDKIKTCMYCNKVFFAEGRKDYCSTKCLDNSRDRKEYIKQYIRPYKTKLCEYCGNEFRTQKTKRFCSYRCSGINKRKLIDIPNIDDSFGYWLAGLVDGEGCFKLVTTKKRELPQPSLTINLRSDDKNTLLMIKNILGFGCFTENMIKITVDGRKLNPMCGYVVSSVNGCKILSDIFSKYPLRSKKNKDFQIWKEAIEILLSDNIDKKILGELKNKINEVKLYHDEILSCI